MTTAMHQDPITVKSEEKMEKCTPIYTITRFLWLWMGFAYKDKPAKVPAGFKKFVEIAEDILRIWESTENDIEAKVGHRDISLISVDVFDDGHVEPHYEVLKQTQVSENVVLPVRRCYIRFLLAHGK